MLIGNVSDIGSLAPYFLIDVSAVYSIEMYFLNHSLYFALLTRELNEYIYIYDR